MHTGISIYFFSNFTRGGAQRGVVQYVLNGSRVKVCRAPYYKARGIYISISRRCIQVSLCVSSQTSRGEERSGAWCSTSSTGRASRYVQLHNI